jgi:hypothetical protein
MSETANRSFRRQGIVRPVAASLGALALVASLSACESINETFGFSKKPPDEFSVVRSAPLTLPPDYTLRPPKPGAPDANQASLRDQAESVLLEEAGASPAESTAASSGETALIERAGAADVDPNIRQILDRDATRQAPKEESFFDSLIFWRDDDPPGDVVDAEAEAERLREDDDAE